MHYQIFLPGARGTAAAELRAVGLSDLVDGANYLDVRSGPNDTAGVVVAWPRPGYAEHGYFADRQTWTPALPQDGLAAERYWIGLWNDSPVTPCDIVRTHQFPGVAVTLGDGQAWEVPEAGLLPRDWQINAADGKWECVVQDRFRQFWERSQLFYAAFLAWSGEGGITVNADWPDYCMQALSLNYRVVPELANLLKLWNTNTLLSAAMATVSADTIATVEAEKKRMAGAAIPAG